MKNNFIRQVIFPVVAALIWGTAFVAQSVAAGAVPPFAFNAVRSAVAVAFLYPVSRVFDALAVKRGEPPEKTDRRKLVLGALCCGLILAISANLQQAGLADTSAGKAGFITAFYVVLVPVFGVFLGRRSGGQLWFSVALVAVGLYLLCIKAGEGLKVETGDFFIILCSIFFAFHVLTVDYWAQRVDGIKLSCAQFAVVAVVSAALSLCFEEVDWSAMLQCVPQLLYMGIGSSGIAYTLQILAQKDSNPTIVSLLFSLESVFSVLAGAIILGDQMTGREYLGCALMFIAVILAQIPLKKKEERLQ